jgi:alanyl-tRNA synthetase
MTMYTKFGQYMPTDLAFYKDTSKTSDRVYVDTIVIHERFGLSIVLSSTLFYPQGGGQKGDKGWVEIDDVFVELGKIPKKIQIKDTKKDGALVLHLVENTDEIDLDRFNEVISGNLVNIEINSGFRNNQMRLHSIAHLLHFFTEEKAGKELPYPVSSDLQDTFGVNKYNAPNLIPVESAEEVKKQFHDFAVKAYEITTYPDETKEGFRYWKCDSYIVPCGGAHLKNTVEIGDFDVQISTKKDQTSIKFTIR